MGPYLYNQHFVAMMNIINKNKLCPPKVGHKHHIIPKCWFKMNNLEVDNTEANLVLLSYEDHVKVHKLAILCAATDSFRSKMGFAVHRLTNGDFSGMKHTKETIEIIKDKRKNQIMTDVTRKRISESLAGRAKPTRSAEHCKHLSESLSDKPRYSRRNKALSDFGKKYIAHFGYGFSLNKRQYRTEHGWYSKHNKQCRWEE